MTMYMRPKLKSFIEYYSTEDKIFFFRRPSVAIEFDDPTKFIATTCKLMDGSLNLDQIKDTLSSLFPNEMDDLDELLIALDNEYLLEDCSKNRKQELSQYEVTRWSRNIEFFGAYCMASENKYSYQQTLKQKKVTLLGLGGVGSNVLYNLAAMGVYNFKVVEFDRVELSNLNRQIIYSESDIGKFKTDAAKKEIMKFFPGINIEFINKKISSVGDINEVVDGQDIVISAVDQPREKIIDWLNEACINKKVPFLCGALDSRLAIYYAIIPGKTGCIQCWKEVSRKNKLIFQDIIQKDGFFYAESTNVAIMPFVSILAGLLANEFLKIVTEIAEPQSLGRLCAFDFVTSQITFPESWEKSPFCRNCYHA